MLFDLFDEDSNGRISYLELARCLALITDPDLSKRCDYLFKRHATPPALSGGALTADGLAKILAAVDSNTPVNHARALAETFMVKGGLGLGQTMNHQQFRHEVMNGSLRDPLRRFMVETRLSIHGGAPRFNPNQQHGGGNWGGQQHGGGNWGQGGGFQNGQQGGGRRGRKGQNGGNWQQGGQQQGGGGNWQGGGRGQGRGRGGGGGGPGPGGRYPPNQAWNPGQGGPQGGMSKNAYKKMMKQQQRQGGGGGGGGQPYDGGAQPY
jgi:hypothetical protein